MSLKKDSCQDNQHIDITKIATFVFCISFALSITIGREVYNSNCVDRFFTDVQFLAFNCLITLILCILTYCFIESVLLKWIQARHNDTIKCKETTFKKWILLWVLIFMSWIPAFLAYYPGILTYDSHTQTRISLGLIDNSRYHPPLHTLIWKVCIAIENRTAIPALAIYGFAQMLVLSFALSYMILIIFKNSSTKYVRIISIVYVLFNPTIAIMSIAMTKDVLFAAFLTVLVMRFFVLQINHILFFAKWENSFFLIVLCVATCLLRNNMIYAFVLAMAIMILVSKECRKQLSLILAVSIIIFSLINGPIYNGIGIKKGNSGEALSVPMQQIARVVVYHEDEILQEEKTLINHFVPYDSLEELYNPRFADPIKKKFDSEYCSTHKKEFLKLWIRLFLKYPVEYINAFLDLNVPYWYLGSYPIDSYSHRQFIETDNYKLDFYPVERTSKAPIILEYYEAISKLTLFSKWPVVAKCLFSLATPIWLVLLSITLIVRLYGARYASSLFFYAFLWLTYLAGPVSNFRYIFPLYVAYPFFAFVAVDYNEPIGNDEEELDG